MFLDYLITCGNYQIKDKKTQFSSTSIHTYIYLFSQIVCNISKYILFYRFYRHIHCNGGFFDHLPPLDQTIGQIRRLLKTSFSMQLVKKRLTSLFGRSRGSQLWAIICSHPIYSMQYWSKIIYNQKSEKKSAQNSKAQCILEVALELYPLKHFQIKTKKKLSDKKWIEIEGI